MSTIVDKGQKIALAVEIEPHFAREAKARHKANGGDKKSPAAKKSAVGQSPTADRSSKSKSRDKAASAVGVSGKLLQKAQEQRARWYETLADIEAKAAKERQKAGKRIEADLTEKLPEGRRGEAKERAAAEVGMSHKTADKAVEVVHAIDEAEASGDVEKEMGNMFPK